MIVNGYKNRLFRCDQEDDKKTLSHPLMTMSSARSFSLSPRESLAWMTNSYLSLSWFFCLTNTSLGKNWLIRLNHYQLFPMSLAMNSSAQFSVMLIILLHQFILWISKLKIFKENLSVVINLLIVRLDFSKYEHNLML